MLSQLFSRRDRLTRNEYGFTLIELLIVVIIVGLLAAISLPIFLNQQRVAVDASVKSDVRNTVENVQNWRVDHRTDVAANTSAYVAAGGTVAKSRQGAVVGVVAKADGSYTVCAFDEGGNDYTQAEKAWAFDSATGKFAVTASSTCEGAVDGSGNDLSTTPIAPKLSGSTTLAAGTQDTDYSATLTASGNPTPTFSTPTSGAGQLPAGLTLNATSGVISGQPTGSGTFTISVTAKNFKGTDTKDYTLSVASKDAAPAFAQGTSATAPTASRGMQYAGYDASANGYPAPKYTVASGTLPSGLQLDADTGAISGTPDSNAVSGTSVIKATNRAGSKTLTLTINVQYAAGFDAASSLTTGFTDSPYNQTIRVTGNPVPTTTITASSLPTGVTAKVAASDGSVTVSGTPTQAGSWSLSLRTVNSVGSAATQTYTFTTASNTVFSEDFESYAATAGPYGGGTVPTGWALTGGACYGGRGVASPSSNSNGYAQTKYLFFNSCAEDDLVISSPTVNLTPGTYTFSGAFSGVYYSAVRSTTMYVIDTSTSTSLGSVNSGNGGYDMTQRSVNVTVTKNTTVRLRFNIVSTHAYTTGSSYGAAVDNVSVKRVS